MPKGSRDNLGTTFGRGPPTKFGGQKRSLFGVISPTFDFDGTYIWN